MSHIINPERRDPSYLKNKAEFGLSKVDNVSSKDILRTTFDLLKDEYWRGEKYSLTTEKTLFPLCKFTTKSTRLTVLVGFYRDTDLLNLISYVKAEIIFDKEFNNLSETNDPIFDISFEKSQKLTVLGEFILYKDEDPSDKKEYEYLGFNFLSASEGYQLSICVNEYPNFGDGLDFHSSIELCDRTPKDTPSNTDNILKKVSINSSERVVSSISKSLAVYDEEGNICHETFDKTSGIPSGYSVPTINGVPFTGEGDFRSIEIQAQHPGSTLEYTGKHDWEVLSNVPTVTYRAAKPHVEKQYSATDTVESKYGLCRLAKVSRVTSVSQSDKANLGIAINNLSLSINLIFNSKHYF